MKENKNDSTTVLARFGRDKRQRTVTATAERVERRPRLQRDAADAEQTPRPKRASYNPNFTHDNRPTFEEKPRRSLQNRYDTPSQENDNRPFGKKTYRSFGDKPAYDSKPRFDNDRPRFGSKPYRGPQNRYEDAPQQDGRRQFSEQRGPKHFGTKPGFRSDDDRKGGPKKFGPKNHGEKYASDKKSGRPYGDKPAFRKRNDKPVSYPKYDPAKQTGEMRLNRYLAQSGICSRREADDFITAGLVSVNGRIITELGTKVMPTDEVKFNDSRVEGEKKVYLVLNKPKGYVTSLDDPHAGKTVMELVAGACEERVYPVGRLDKNSLGLLLFTNDGDLTKQLTHPSYRKKKIYQVSLDKPLTRADMDRIAEGITLEDGEIFADEISYVKENKQEIGIEIHSGRNRIVRRIFEFLGYTVTKLDRVYYAGLTKKNLKRGAWRFLSREEVERLKSGRYE